MAGRTRKWQRHQHHRHQQNHPFSHNAPPIQLFDAGFWHTAEPVQDRSRRTAPHPQGTPAGATPGVQKPGCSSCILLCSDLAGRPSTARPGLLMRSAGSESLASGTRAAIHPLMAFLAGRGPQFLAGCPACPPRGSSRVSAPVRLDRDPRALSSALLGRPLAKRSPSQDRRDGPRDLRRDPPATPQIPGPSPRHPAHPAPESSRPTPAGRPVPGAAVPHRDLADSTDARGRISDLSRCLSGCEGLAASTSRSGAVSRPRHPATLRASRQPNLSRIQRTLAASIRTRSISAIGVAFAGAGSQRRGPTETGSQPRFTAFSALPC